MIIFKIILYPFMVAIRILRLIVDGIVYIGFLFCWPDEFDYSIGKSPWDAVKCLFKYIFGKV